MKIAFFSTHTYDKVFFERANEKYRFQIEYFEPALDENTAAMTEGYTAVCVFVNDRLNQATLEKLSSNGVQYIALRCAGFNNIANTI